VAVLLVDIGNSRLKWQWGEHAWGAECYHSVELETQLSLWWGEHQVAPTALWIASVVPTIPPRIAQWAARHWQCPVHHVVTQATYQGLSNGYANPAQLGVDRWLGMIGARQLCEGAFCVVDCGSAVTLDWVDAQSHHHGGWIMPGLQLMEQALAAKSPLLAQNLSASTHRVCDAKPPNRPHLGRDTVSGVTIGALHAVVGAIDHTLGNARQVCFLTGGDAPLVAQALQRETRVVPNLVLQGLKRVAHS